MPAVRSLAQALADSTGGTHFASTEPALDIAESIVEMVMTACSAFTDCNANGNLDECDIASGISADLDENGVPDECEGPSGIADPQPRYPVVHLGQNTPNPFNPVTSIRFDLPRGAPVELFVFSADGRRVATLANDWLPAGNHEVLWRGRDDNGRSVSSGVYFYRLVVQGHSLTKRMVLLR